MRRLFAWLAVAIMVFGSAACMARTGATAGSGSQAPSRSGSLTQRSPVQQPAASTTAVENALPGTTAWRLGDPGPEPAIEGYADRVSVLPGESFRLFVSTTATGFHAVAYRMGWYGGRRGREVWHSDHLTGHRQPPATVSSPLNTVTADWSPSLVVPTDGWPEGDYLIKLTSDQGFERYVPITIRSSTTRGKVVLLNSVATWQAYNTWGGFDLYTGPTGRVTRGPISPSLAPTPSIGMSDSRRRSLARIAW
jgi:hypothetical protein